MNKKLQQYAEKHSSLNCLSNYQKIIIVRMIHKPKQPESITLPIEDYNRLRKLEIKNQIKKLKKELKGL